MPVVFPEAWEEAGIYPSAGLEALNIRSDANVQSGRKGREAATLPGEGVRVDSNDSLHRGTPTVKLRDEKFPGRADG
jgi:hypothetical protein